MFSKKPIIRLFSSESMRMCQKFIFFLFILLFGYCISFFQGVFNVQAINYSIFQQPNLDCDDEIELAYGVPTLISEISVPSGNIFGGQIIDCLYLKTNFSNNNGSIWINDQINDTIWQDYLNRTIEKFINTNSSSILKYSLWANSFTLGNITLHFTFKARIIHVDNIGLGILLVLLPIIIVGSIIFGILYWRKKDSHSVRVARRIGERLTQKFEDKFKNDKNIYCPIVELRYLINTINFAQIVVPS